MAARRLHLPSRRAKNGSFLRLNLMSSRLSFLPRIVVAGLVFGLGLFLGDGALGQRITDGEEALRKKDSTKVEAGGEQMTLSKLRDKLVKGVEGFDANTPMA